MPSFLYLNYILLLGFLQGFLAFSTFDKKISFCYDFFIARNKKAFLNDYRAGLRSGSSALRTIGLD